MEPKKRQQALLAVLLLALAVVVGYRYLWPPSTSPAAASNVKGGRTAARPDNQAASGPQVRLDALNAPRPTPGSGERNLFRFQPKAPPPPPPAPPRPATTPGLGQPALPVGPPPPPPITLKFIGIVETPGTREKIAVLTDGRAVFQGKEGAIIEGRYKVLRIGAESIEMAYADGRGRQTIRLTGS